MIASHQIGDDAMRYGFLIDMDGVIYRGRNRSSTPVIQAKRRFATRTRLTTRDAGAIVRSGGRNTNR